MKNSVLIGLYNKIVFILINKFNFQNRGVKLEKWGKKNQKRS